VPFCIVSQNTPIAPDARFREALVFDNSVSDGQALAYWRKQWSTLSRRTLKSWVFVFQMSNSALCWSIKDRWVVPFLGNDNARAELLYQSPKAGQFVNLAKCNTPLSQPINSKLLSSHRPIQSSSADIADRLCFSCVPTIFKSFACYGASH
jgi:hypothetical protein